MIGSGDDRAYAGEGHFFAVAAEAMRHVLVDRARRKRREKHGGGRRRVELHDDVRAAPPDRADDLLALDEALDRLAIEDPEAARLVQIRYFAGLSVEEAAASLGMSRATTYRQWAFARAWLLEELGGGGPS